jgi:hypothetical protein
VKANIARLKTLSEQYGPVAMVLHVAGFFVTMGGFTAALTTGFAVEGAAAGTGTLMAAYIATKAVSPLRILVTLAATPVVGRRFRREVSPTEG